MRDALQKALLRHSDNERFVFLTGDLGFGALEPLQNKMGGRFINAGIAEQNMIGVAAGMAKEGMLPWTYSIAPFLYARAFEQIKNNVVSHGLPVVLAGNGGGYGYGVMGATHHALEDCAVMSALPGCDVIVPCYARDVEDIVEDLFSNPRPAFLRLGRAEAKPEADVGQFMAWRCLLPGANGVLVTMGPLAGAIVDALKERNHKSRPSLWAVGRLPIEASLIPEEFLLAVQDQSLTIVEEHYGSGGLGASLSLALAKLDIHPKGRITHLHAQGYPSKRYGSQGFHRKESGIDPESIMNQLRWDLHD